MNKKVSVLILALSLTLGSSMAVLAETNTNPDGVSVPQETTHISINLNDPTSPYLVKTEILSEAETRGTSKPTKAWALYDNQYTWSAYVTNNTMYSNYYFTQHNGKFRMYANIPISCSASTYSIKIYEKRSTDTLVKTYSVGKTQSADFYNTTDVSSNNAFYFSISGGTISVEGFVDTY